MKRLLITLCLLCSLVAATPTRAAFNPTTPHQVVPKDSLTDAHNQIASSIDSYAAANLVVRDLLASWGWSGAPFSKEDQAYLRTHRSGAARSLYAHLVAVLFEQKLIGVFVEPAPDSTDYPGKPSYSDALKRLEIYGLTIATAGYGEQRFFVERYWQNKLTPANDAAWMARERGLYALPEQVCVSIEVRGLYGELERDIARWGLSGQEADRIEAYNSYFAFEGVAIPGPADAPVAGDVCFNPRRVFYGGRKIENAIVQGRASDAAKSGTRVGWLLGTQSLYEQYAMQTYPLSENDWRAALGIFTPGNQGPGFWIGGTGSGANN